MEIIEVKGDNKIDDSVVEAKAYAAMDLAEKKELKLSSTIAEFSLRDDANISDNQVIILR